MPFRDEREAAQARADALAVELADRDARLAARERELDQTRSELERARRGESLEAREHLDALVHSEGARRDARKKAARQLRRADQSPVEKQRVKRLLRSVEGDLDAVTLAWVLALVLAVASVAGFVEAGWLLGTLSGVGALALALGSLRLEQRGRQRSATREFEWAATRPYALVGYPELLDAGGHSMLTLRMAFDGEEPLELHPILSAFDDDLERIGDGVYTRKSPITEVADGTGIADHNLAIHYWFKDCASAVLAPLHHAHKLSRVELTLE